MTIAEVLAEIGPLVRWHRTSTGLPQVPLPLDATQVLPRDYLEAMAVLGAGEGFVGPNYLRLYPLEELPAVNVLYETEKYLPEAVLFGSTGGGEAYAFLFESNQRRIIRVPFIPLNLGYAIDEPADFGTFLKTLATALPGAEGPFPPLVEKSALGKEVHEVHPIALGGKAEPTNQVLLEPEVHAQLCRFWNGVFKRATAQSPIGA